MIEVLLPIGDFVKIKMTKYLVLFALFSTVLVVPTFAMDEDYQKPYYDKTRNVEPVVLPTFQKLVESVNEEQEIRGNSYRITIEDITVEKKPEIFKIKTVNFETLALIKTAREAIRKGCYQEAADCLESAIPTVERDFSVYAMSAYAHEKLRNTTKANEHWRKSLTFIDTLVEKSGKLRTTTSLDTTNLSYLGYYYSTLGQHQKAVDYFDKVLMCGDPFQNEDFFLALVRTFQSCQETARLKKCLQAYVEGTRFKNWLPRETAAKIIKIL